MDRYEELNKIGEGAFGEVYWAKDKYLGGTDALKKLKGHSEDITAELKVLMKLKHDGIVRLKGLIHSDDGGSWLQMEYCNGGNLNEFWKQKKPNLGLKHRFMKEIAVSVGHLHENLIVHRDLKPENILIAYVDNEPHTKIGDFGLATSQVQAQYLSTKVGTQFFTAPEIYQEEPKYTNLADVFSMGVIFRALVFDKSVKVMGKSYLGDCHYSNGVYPIPYGQAMASNPSFKVVTPEASIKNYYARSILDKMLAANYKDRPTAKEVGRHISEDTTYIDFKVNADSKEVVEGGVKATHASHKDSGFSEGKAQDSQDMYLKQLTTNMRRVSSARGTRSTPSSRSSVPLSRDQLSQTRNLVMLWENMLTPGDSGKAAASSTPKRQVKSDTGVVVQSLDLMQRGSTLSDAEMESFARAWTKLDDIFRDNSSSDSSFSSDSSEEEGGEEEDSKKEDNGLQTVVNIKPQKVMKN